MTEDVKIAMEQQPTEPAVPDDANNMTQPEHLRQQRCTGNTCVKCLWRVFHVLEVLKVLFCDIILYLLDVGSDIANAMLDFQGGHPIWGSLTTAFFVLPAIFWAAINWAWWYRDHKKDSTYRRKRMLMSILLLDPLVR